MTAAHRDTLSQAINRLPGLLAAAQPALQQLDTVAVSGTPLVQQIHAAVPVSQPGRHRPRPVRRRRQARARRAGADAGQGGAGDLRGHAGGARAPQLHGASRCASTKLMGRLFVEPPAARVHRELPHRLLLHRRAHRALRRTSHFAPTYLIFPPGNCALYAATPTAGCSANFGQQPAYTPSNTLAQIGGRDGRACGTPARKLEQREQRERRRRAGGAADAAAPSRRPSRRSPACCTARRACPRRPSRRCGRCSRAASPRAASPSRTSSPTCSNESTAQDRGRDLRQPDAGRDDHDPDRASSPSTCPTSPRTGCRSCPSYSVNVDVENAAQLVKNADVRVGGARVGQVLTITAEPRDSTWPHPYARLKLQLQKSLEPLPLDTYLPGPHRVGARRQVLGDHPGAQRQAGAAGRRDVPPAAQRDAVPPRPRLTPCDHDSGVVDLDTAFRTFGPKTTARGCETPSGSSAMRSPAGARSSTTRSTRCAS